ncbi:DNA polymerase Y family protein [Sphingomonas sp.]|uniref:Y-family DNA polymerase n=1 Tax=Sphingomonas sp. TaxID=28214 RepID=UPI001D533C06|nr:DNA polymerase Y family protein [Sphingomonas sp.]MBX9796865.1 DNA polymerase Y family protein [Sphingomonas sp.]
MAASSTSRRFLALVAPRLSCDRLAWQGTRPEGPYAFVEKRANAMRLAAVDPRAAALGIAPGLTLADARARLPELVTYPHDAIADRAFLERLAEACERYSPSIALDPPDGVTLDIAGCTHPFGGEDALAADAVRRFARFVTLNAAIADTPEAAQALAHHNAPCVEALPVAALRLDEEATTALLRAGLKTVGDLADRPSAALAARFGPLAADRLARLLGRVDSRLTPRRKRPPILVERRFAEPVAMIDHIIAVADELLHEACAMLAGRDQGCRRCGIALFRSDGDVRRLSVEAGQPQRDPGTLLRLMRERIEGLRDPLDPGFGYDMVRLGLARLEALPPAQLALEGGSLSDDALAALIDRLSIRLGRAQVRRLVHVDSHLPEQAVLALPAQDMGRPQPWPLPDPGEPPLRPIHLFDPPEVIEVIAEVPDGPPHRFRWRRTLHEVTRAEGPERLASQWWRRADGGGLTRDYYRVEDALGRRFWVFRHGLYGHEKAQPAWYLHGLFA